VAERLYEPPRVLWRLQLLREWSHEREQRSEHPSMWAAVESNASMIGRSRAASCARSPADANHDANRFFQQPGKEE
ncbi:hypothetical protein, partial [Burkholderia pseudomallei]|uniref:hypothetical protein n=2 Tax=Burkholderia pseudomallei TaxID=28450 RepID=UPI00194038AB